MKKAITLIISLAMLISLRMDVRAVETDMRGDTVRIEYADFCQNEELYWSYVQNGATVLIHLDEMAKEKYSTIIGDGEALIASDKERGLTKPTGMWDVSQSGTYTIAKSFAYSGTLYSSYRFTGIRSYGVALFNWSDTTPVTVYAQDAVFSYYNGPVTIDPGYCALSLIILKYENGSFYLEMPAPVDGINGYVGEYSTVAELM